MMRALYTVLLYEATPNLASKRSSIPSRMYQCSMTSTFSASLAKTLSMSCGPAMGFCIWACAICWPTWEAAVEHQHIVTLGKAALRLTIIASEDEVVHWLQAEKSEEVPAQARNPPDIEIAGADASLEHLLELRCEGKRKFHCISRQCCVRRPGSRASH